jgi:hypothetical protein
MAAFFRLSKGAHKVQHADGGATNATAAAPAPTTAIVPAGGGAGAAVPLPARRLYSDVAVVAVRAGLKALATVLQMEGAAANPVLARWKAAAGPRVDQSREFNRVALKAGASPPTEEQQDAEGFNEADYYELAPNSKYDHAAYGAWCEGVVHALLDTLGPHVDALEAKDVALLDAGLPLLEELGAREMWDSLDEGSQEWLADRLSELAQSAKMYRLYSSPTPAMLHMNAMAADMAADMERGMTLVAIMRKYAPKLKRMFDSLSPEDKEGLKSNLDRDGKGITGMADSIMPQLMGILGGGGGDPAGLAGMLGGMMGGGGMGALGSMFGM